MPVSEKAASEVLALPMFPELSEAEIRRVVERIAEFYRKRFTASLTAETLENLPEKDLSNSLRTPRLLRFKIFFFSADAWPFWTHFAPALLPARAPADHRRVSLYLRSMTLPASSCTRITNIGKGSFLVETLLRDGYG